MKKILLVLILIIISLVSFYFLFPKYYFFSTNIVVMRCNKITGKIDYFLITDEYKKQHPQIDFIPVRKVEDPTKE